MVKTWRSAASYSVAENGTSETVHFRITPLAGPSAEEKLLQRLWHTESWLTRIAARAIHGIQINRNRGFGAVFHTQYVGTAGMLVKAQDAAVARYSYWRQVKFRLDGLVAVCTLLLTIYKYVLYICCDVKRLLGFASPDYWPPMRTVKLSGALFAGHVMVVPDPLS